MGALPDLLPGYQQVADDDGARALRARPGGCRSPAEPGLRIPEMFDAAIDGRLKALYVFGEDIAQTDPDTGHVRAALEACELVDLPGDLPLRDRRARRRRAAGRVVPREGRHVRQLRPPLPAGAARARPARRGAHRLRHHPRASRAALGVDLGCPTPADAMAECAALTPAVRRDLARRLDREGPLHWPCRVADGPGRGDAVPRAVRDPERPGAARRAPVRCRRARSPTPTYPFMLVTGRRLEHYNAGTMTRRTANLELVPEELLELHPDDAGAARGRATATAVEVDEPARRRSRLAARGHRASRARARCSWPSTSPRRSPTCSPRSTRTSVTSLPRVQGDRGPARRAQRRGGRLSGGPGYRFLGMYRSVMEDRPRPGAHRYERTVR